MGAFVSIPYTTGHQTILVGGTLINFQYSLDGKGVITITVGDPWEVITERLSPDEFATRKQEVVRSVANTQSVSPRTASIECGQGCEDAFQAALKRGDNRFQALENYRNCIRSCFGIGPAPVKEEFPR